MFDNGETPTSEDVRSKKVLDDVSVFFSSSSLESIDFSNGRVFKN